MRYWLMKSEPDEFSIDDLAAAKKQTTSWFGVRNYQARNFMRDQMKLGDLAFFYHSSCPEPGIVGVVEVSAPAHPDESQFDRKSPYYDAKSKRDAPRWVRVDARPAARQSAVDHAGRSRRVGARREARARLRRGPRLSLDLTLIVAFLA